MVFSYRSGVVSVALLIQPERRDEAEHSDFAPACAVVAYQTRSEHKLGEWDWFWPADFGAVLRASLIGQDQNMWGFPVSRSSFSLPPWMLL